MKNILVLHGPNLNLLGERPGDEPALTLDALNHRLHARAAELAVTLRTFQSNHEGELIDRLHAERHWADGVVLSPDALAHTSYALREAIVAIATPTVEVHLSDIRRRESWRRKSVLKDACVGQVVGKGIDSYLIGLERLVAGDARASTRAKGKAAAAKRDGAVRAQKTVGRGAATAAGSKSSGAPPKTMGGADGATAPRAEASRGKTIGREPLPSTAAAGAERPRGARNEVSARATDFLTRALVRQKIAERLSGKLTPVALAAWARTQWNKVQEGAPAEAGHRDRLEDALQTLTLSTVAASRLSDDQLVDLMAELEG